MKKLFDSIWYRWPRFPGAFFHLAATNLFWLLVGYGFWLIIKKHLLP